MADHSGAVAEFFDEFVTAFSSFDGKTVGALFVTPGVALKHDGTLHGFAAHDEIEAYYQAALDRYRDAGCRSCRYYDLDVQRAGGDVVTATVSWDLLDAGGTVKHTWRQAYFLSRFSGGWRIFGSAFVPK